MLSLPLGRFLLSIDFNRYVGTSLGTKGTSDTTFGSGHVNDVVATSIELARIGQYVLGAGCDAQPAALAAPPVNYYDPFWHTCAPSQS